MKKKPIATMITEFDGGGGPPRSVVVSCDEAERSLNLLEKAAKLVGGEIAPSPQGLLANLQQLRAELIASSAKVFR